MKTIHSFFKKHREDLFPDYGVLLKVTVGIFSSILVVCIMHLMRILV